MTKRKRSKEELYYVELSLGVQANSYEQAARRARKFIMEQVDGPLRFNVAKGADAQLRYVDLQEIVVGD